MTQANTALFTKHPEHCPQCNGELVVRSGQHSRFLGCSHYPECDYIRPLKAQVEGHVLKELTGQHCPVCVTTLVLRQGRYGMFICCGNYPKCPHTEAIDKPDTTTLTCPLCGQGELLQRKSRFGKTFYACSRYPDCHLTVNGLPIAGQCEYCHYPLLIEKKTAKGLHPFCASRQCGKRVAKD